MRKSKRQARPSGQSNRLRIIAGDWRGRVLSFPDVEGLRPTGDRMREMVFNWLQFDVPRAHCLDLFAGSGALGFEAASRGARSVTLFEIAPKAIKTLQANVQQLAAEDRMTIMAESAVTWLAAHPAEQSPTRYDLVFIDPPFEAKLHQQVCELLNQSGVLAPEAKLYLEQPMHEEAYTLPENWVLLKSKKMGDVLAQLYQYNAHS